MHNLGKTLQGEKEGRQGEWKERRKKGRGKVGGRQVEWEGGKQECGEA